MDASEYVKQISSSEWEVKLGAGILPITVTRQDVDYMNSMTFGTHSIPPRYVDIGGFMKVVKAVAAVNKFLANAS